MGPYLYIGPASDNPLAKLKINPIVNNVIMYINVGISTSEVCMHSVNIDIFPTEMDI